MPYHTYIKPIIILKLWNPIFLYHMLFQVWARVGVAESPTRFGSGPHRVKHIKKCYHFSVRTSCPRRWALCLCHEWALMSCRRSIGGPTLILRWICMCITGQSYLHIGACPMPSLPLPWPKAKATIIHSAIIRIIVITTECYYNPIIVVPFSFPLSLYT